MQSFLLNSHVMREYNIIAHSLTRYALIILNFIVWIEDVLSFLLVVLPDITGLP